MENASKALIIAGAVLISILLIGLGVMIFNPSKELTEQAKNTSEVLGNKASNSVQRINSTLQGL